MAHSDFLIVYAYFSTAIDVVLTSEYVINWGFHAGSQKYAPGIMYARKV